jgi:hypothetical protein
MAARQFEVVSDETPAVEKPDNSFATRALMLGLQALSQRAIAAIADLFMLATVGSAFWLWYLTPKPDLFQIASLTIYALFVLAANFIVRRR